MASTLHTYLDRKADARKMATFLRRRNVLSSVNSKRKGHVQFTMIVPHTIDEKGARRLLREAIAHAGQPMTEPAVWTQDAERSQAHMTIDPPEEPIGVRRDGDKPVPQPAPFDMRTRIRERCELAITYAEDGAYHSAARVLQSIADETAEHAKRVL